MRYTLMNQEHEVLDFEIKADSEVPEDVRMCEGSAWAPLDIPTDGRDPVPALFRFLWQRTIRPGRQELMEILHATHASSELELALRSGGFSLSDQYWYRGKGSPLTWRGSNYFDNAWDPSFGKALLRGDYAALTPDSIYTPDVTLGGSRRKAWIQTEQGCRLFKASPSEDDSGIYCEALVSRMLDRLVGTSGHVPYEPAELDGEVFSTCPVMVGRNEEFVRGTQLLAKEGVVTDGLTAKEGLPDIEKYLGLFQQALEESGVHEYREIIAKLFVVSSLTLDFDTHPGNCGLIRDLETLELRLAPLFDHDRAFAFMKDKFEIIRTSPVAANLILGMYFSRLDPSWDYSWYDPHALDGFEDEVMDSLSAIESLPEGYAELMVNLFLKQRNYVNRVAVPD